MENPNFIMYKIVMQAVENGYTGSFKYLPKFWFQNSFLSLPKTECQSMIGLYFLKNFNSIIFEQTFAKAFFGTKKQKYYEHNSNDEGYHFYFEEPWKRELKNLVVAENRLKVLATFLKE